MGTLADVLNAPYVVEVGGADYNVRRLSLGETYTCVQSGMREQDPDIRGTELQDATQKALDSGRFPRQALEKVLFAAMSDCNEGFDVADSKAMSTLEHIDIASDIVLYACGFSDSIKKAPATQEKEKENQSR